MESGSLQAMRAGTSMGYLEKNRSCQVSRGDSTILYSYWHVASKNTGASTSFFYKKRFFLMKIRDLCISDRAAAEQRQIEQQAVTENVGAKVTQLGLDLRRIETRSNDQHHFIRTTDCDTQSVREQHTSVAGSIQIQQEGIKTQLQLTDANFQGLSTKVVAHNDMVIQNQVRLLGQMQELAREFTISQDIPP